MKIVYLTELLTNGGTAKHLAELLPRLRDAGIEPVVWSRGEQGRYAGQLRDSGIEVEPMSRIETALLSRGRMRGVQLVHSYLYGSHVSDALICRARGIPYIKSTRNTGHWFTNRPAVRLRVALRTPLIRQHLVNSSGVADYLVNEERVARKNIAVIPNGMIDRFDDGPFLNRADLELAADDFVLLSVAWLKPHKSLDFVIRSLAGILPLAPGVRLVLAGDGPEDARLRAMASELGVAHACRFLGRHPAPHALARLADVAVSASEKEGMSNSSIECQMMGVPVIACIEAAGNPDIVTSGTNGYLYSFGDQRGFESHVAGLIRDRALLQSMREASRRQFLEKFTLKSQVESFLELYKGIAGRWAASA